MATDIVNDLGRNKVYEAEDLVFSGTLFSEPLGMSGVASLRAAMFAHPWWVTHVNRYPKLTVTRRNITTSTAHGTGEIRLSLGGENAHVFGHEAAHVADLVYGDPSSTPHGPSFRAVMLDVFTLLGGEVTATRLEKSFRSQGQEVGSRHPVTPTSGHERGIYGLWRIGWVNSHDTSTR